MCFFIKSTRDDYVANCLETIKQLNLINAIVHIGKGCVIGASSYVNKDVPDYCVAVGSSARIVKAYSYKLKAWIAVKDAETYEKILEERQQK